jgi:hypothetical protein
MVVEGALEGELDDHLGYGKHDAATAWGQRVANANCDRIGGADHAQNRAICMP